MLCTSHRTNLVVSMPLTENMPGPSATKPGDMWVLFFNTWFNGTNGF